jgi:hypothetical protein
LDVPGLNDPFGDLVDNPQPTSNPTVGFNPAYVCAAYMRFDGLEMKARHAYLPITAADAPDVIAKDLLQAIGSNEYGNLRPEIRDNFTLFGFNSQQVVYLFVDNDPNTIGFDATAQPENIVRFTQFSGIAPHRPRRMNYAFAGGRWVDFSQIMGGTLAWDRNCNIGYALDFWNTDDNGRPITGVVRNDPFTHYLYSMNIHLRMLTGSLPAPPAGVTPPPPAPPGVNFVPVIVDPDTGNMGGIP